MDIRWKKINEKVVQINRFRKFKRVRYRLPTGAVGNFYLRMPTWGNPVVALVLTPQKKVVLAEQFRPGPERVLWELPGGGCMKGETPRQAIEREVIEETGYHGKVRLVARSTNDAWATLSRSHFVITDAIQIAKPNNEHFEVTRVRLVSLKEFRRRLRAGLMTDVEAGYLSLDALGLL